jgi:hypothetical protein
MGIERLMRPGRERVDDRKELSREVSYKVDVYNIFLPGLNDLNPQLSINFVCSGRFYNWAPNPLLRAHQRSPLFLIMLIANLCVSADGPSTTQKINELKDFLNYQIARGKRLLDYCADHGQIPLEIKHEIELFLYTNYRAYMDMSKDLSPKAVQADTTGTSLPSYTDYLEMLDGKKRHVEASMKAVHDLIDDRADDVYRDFISDERIKSALSSLKLG